MPTHIIAAARSSSGAGRSASQVLASAFFNQGRPSALLEAVSVDPKSAGPMLVAPLAFSAEEMFKVIIEQRPRVEVIAYVEQPNEQLLRQLLPLADTVTVAGDRTGNLDHAAELYDVLARLEIKGASGRALQPWLLPSGWPCRLNPGVRLRGWQAQLERRAFPGRLRCLPLILPWSDLGSLVRATKERVDATGACLAEHLARIADGLAPVRPAGGLAGGDPWPDLPPPAPVVRLAGVRQRPHLLQGA